MSRKIAYFRPKSRIFVQKPSFAQDVAKSQKENGLQTDGRTDGRKDGRTGTDDFSSQRIKKPRASRGVVVHCQQDG